MTELEQEVDRLSEMVSQENQLREIRLRDAKLRSLAEFAAGAGHEINNPLAIISGQAQFLLAKEQDADRRKSLQTVIRQAHRIHQMILELMSFARPTPPRKHPCQLRQVIQDAISEVRKWSTPKEVTVELDTFEGDWLVSADSRQLLTAIVSLIRNAIEAAPKGGWVRISIDQSASNSLTIVVADNGPGLSQHQQEHAFDPFYSGRPAGRGRGFGLPAAWRIVEQHGGTLEYDRLGDTTRFVITIPGTDEILQSGSERKIA
jgi:signal transduction histidine kinase